MYESYIQNYMLFVFSSTSILEICGLDKQIPADSSPENVPRIRSLKKGPASKGKANVFQPPFFRDMLVFRDVFQVLLSMSFFGVYIPQLLTKRTWNLNSLKMPKGNSTSFTTYISIGGLHSTVIS